MKFQKEEKMENTYHKEVEKATTSKRTESLASDASNDDKVNDSSSSSSSGGPNLEGFSEEQMKAFEMMLRKRVGKAIK